MNCQTFAFAEMCGYIGGTLVCEERTLTFVPTTTEFRTLLRCAGVFCSLSSNSETVIEAFRPWLITDCTEPELTINIRVLTFSPGLAPTQFRGMEHLVVARFGENTFLLDLLEKSVEGWVSEEVASDSNFWNQRIIPLILGVMGCAVGVLPLHSACLVSEGHGILLAGHSMAGKSTLAVALAKQGFDFLSDDWVYVRRAGASLEVHGLDAPLKLLSDATAYFPELSQWSPNPTANGEIGFEIAAPQLDLKTSRVCMPSLIIFLERIRTGTAHLARVTGSYTRRFLMNSVERLPHSMAQMAENRRSVIDHIGGLDALRFRYAGSPQYGAAQLSRFIERTLRSHADVLLS
ncbi:Hpr(Ser) kinase/phosphatase [Candidatus Koribacter versatilis Ellin345]|uniref:Hpr(Ser) kinase/phosphatase n=1 Tax=Koribacter versatilis (strain Ellin345) TaxID=204669 RepID=Q1ITC5_KORVE|nr:HPr kinase [Candidatus Koribacter versatilis]ABF39875.1 Hpr(Ser) kinase/phosphatase [Candidatus Koribacter versatilis Ellin345]